VADVGAQWTGPGQDRIRALAEEMGVPSFATYGEGSHVDYDRGNRTLYDAPIPTIDSEAVNEIVQTIMNLDQICTEVDPESPWDCPKAREWDALTFESWLQANVTRESARERLRTVVEAVYGVDTVDLSFLFMLFYARSGNGFFNLVSTEGGAQQDRYDGGTQLIAIRLAEKLGDRVRLSSPVRRITQDNGGVEVEGDGFRVRGKRAIVAIPPTLAGRIDYRPAMPALRDQLTQHSPMARVIKVHAIYDTPFWRDDGLSGRVVSNTGPVKVVFDNTPVAGAPGALVTFVEGSDWKTHGLLPPEERRNAVLDCMVRYFGPKAADPIDYVEKDWPSEEYSRGCYGAVLPAGALFSCGRGLRDPVGRIHWAGTETATVFNGYMDGAVRSGERAAEEVIACLE
jgi:monoamine oxidase